MQAEVPGAWLGSLRWCGRQAARLPRGASWLLVVLWMTLIWWLSSASRLPGPRIWIWGLANNLGHAPLFGLLGMWIAVALAPRPVPDAWPDPGPRLRPVAFALVVLWGLVDEWHQSHVRGRDSSLHDVLTDAIGVGCVLWVAAYLGRPDAREGGLRLRLAVGVLLCLGSAFWATQSSG